MKTICQHVLFHACKGFVICSLFCVSIAWAETDIIPFTGYRLSGEFDNIATGARVDVGDTSSIGFIVNIDDKPGSAYEFLYSRQSSKLKSDISVPAIDLFDIDIEYIHIGGILVEPVNSQLHTFFGAGIGFTHFSPDLSGRSSETKPSFSLTVGYKYTLNPHMGLRLGLRLYGTLVDSNSAIFCSEGACSARFRSDTYTQFEASAGVIIRF